MQVQPQNQAPILKRTVEEVLKYEESNQGVYNKKYNNKGAFQHSQGHIKEKVAVCVRPDFKV